MTEPTLNYLSCAHTNASHRLAYWQWGQPDSAHVVVCVHGLTRQGRDFDVVAQALCAAAGPAGIRVVCPDMAGRGQSDWLQDPVGYQVPLYAADMLALLAHLHAQASIGTLDWLGTSMGGLIGVAVCGTPGLLGVNASAPPAVRRLVLNDVGPALQWQAIVRIGAYLGQPVVFDNLQQAADAMWTLSSSFGPHTPEQWLALSRHMVKPVSSSDSRLRLHYDPAIAQVFNQATEGSTLQNEQLLWQLYDNISAQTLLLRGAQSDLLSPATALAMTQRGPRARLLEFAGVGHAPTLVAAEQSAAVCDFLLP